MTGRELTIRAQSFTTVHILERIYPRMYRRSVLRVCALIVFVSLFLSMRAEFFAHRDVAHGLFFLSSGAWLLLFLVEMYWNYMYFSGIPDAYKDLRHAHVKPEIISYEVADIILSLSEHDVTKSLFAGAYGRRRADRLGIAYNDIMSFFAHRTRPVGHDVYTYDGLLTVHGLAGSFYDKDSEWAEYLAGFGITREVFVEALVWVSEEDTRSKQKEMWWTRSMLGRIPSIGRDWALGTSPLLARFARPLAEHPDYADADILYTDVKDEARMLEDILARSHNANALIVGPSLSVCMNPVRALGHRIEVGTAYPELEHKRVYVLNPDVLFTEAHDLQSLEHILHALFREVVRAEEMIIVITDMTGFIESAKHYSLDVLEVMRPYITSSLVQIIGFIESDTFEQSYRTNTALQELFERMVIHDEAPETLVRMYTQRMIEKAEQSNAIVFTYSATKVLAESVVRLFTPHEYMSRVDTLVEELVSHVSGLHKTHVTRSEVEEMLSIKTGVPGSIVSPREKARLLELETLLHARVVGQESAIRAIADALRRARSGIGNPLRPLGSFLFLGPTGVGKTEMARALAAVFFDSEHDMIRLDMTEYSGTDALMRLIGDFDTGKPGILVSRLREKPYGIVLLDEFEKAHQDVHNLFLQILDEGKFSDMRGDEVNARNTMIIATSNAGSQFIWDMTQKGTDVAGMKDALIEDIVKGGIFKPELLNRFDGVIAFHPLQDTHLHRVAEAMLAKLTARLKEQGYTLVYTQDLVDGLVRMGSDPKFGARPIARAINERVEGAIARRILEGAVKTGDTITLSGKDLV